MSEVLTQGAKDVFLAKVRADFDAVEDQALKATRAIQKYSLIGSNPLADSLYTVVSEVTDDGNRYVWRHVGVAGLKNLGTRSAGGLFPDVEFIRGYETAVYDPDSQLAGKFQVPYEREAKEAKMYKTVLNRAQKLMYEIDRTNIQDPFEPFNMAFTAPTSYPTTGLGGNRFFARGNKGLDGNNTALGERLISTQHARADAGTVFSNAVNVSGNAAAFSDDNFWTAKVQGASLVDDNGKAYPAFGGSVTLVTVPNNMRAAKELNESDWIVDVADNNININKGAFLKLITSPYLLSAAYTTSITSTTQWFMIDESMRDPETGTGLVCVSFVPLASNVYNDEDTNSAVYNIQQTKVYGFVEVRNILGSNGTGAAYSS